MRPFKCFGNIKIRKLIKKYKKNTKINNLYKSKKSLEKSFQKEKNHGPFFGNRKKYNFKNAL